MEKIEFECEIILAKDLLKATDIAQSGGEAKHLIKEYGILVNGEEYFQAGKKLYKGDLVEFNNQFEIRLV
ncbi:RNA-binding S4 domain-containing protein [Anaerococcus hydrogenalis]|uniref:S4 domain protein n=2 Tax=Anaerococcus hydrogenalis TaxID=33029 RepID=F0GYV4_9FIRM|nr:RNA-binding S4 domain-containing protein [Anaerococcus hydrogenalis]EGC84600.1 S4 domain protein [Anaerococcus hydrogenalis ACS-025-V-Sch4]MDK7695548.1 RNA-binding S4 domain-containing protein [Anaerococcus hydrogenalis]MDK7697222.1 RNA-binding S4 domain-containing protein [Anaerococcus hydrogenalis]MDK7708575.1 RNA-binding S4 domain-containing protein [Anaerococcus hydrogenalis]PMC80992.1 RNA-binding S4 domain-containing protein [Anaerococcus hydrogenalis]